MKIADFSLSMQSSHAKSQQSSVKETLNVWVNPPASNTLAPATEQVTLSSAGQAKLANEASSINQAASDAQNDPKLQLIIAMIEKITGRKVKLLDASHLGSAPSATPSTPGVQRSNAGFGMEYSRLVSHSESEQTTFQAVGIVKTQDNKSINFSLSLNMQYQYSETSSTSIRIGSAARLTDPLVVNFSGTAAQLSEQRFAFDLNSDGQAEQINTLASGSGFLALDLNSDGKINDGKELFGPVTGNGFSELAAHDSDRNSWIDESDAVFQQLQVWTKDAAGNEALNGLASMGIGAISLRSVATPFDIKSTANEVLGTVRSSGVSLNENGTVGSVQQIDLTI
ncbi:MAG: hypothetical protein ACOYMG_12270 [Candidatus Methylumidiphilus sp.]